MCFLSATCRAIPKVVGILKSISPSALFLEDSYFVQAIEDGVTPEMSEYTCIAYHHHERDGTLDLCLSWKLRPLDRELSSCHWCLVASSNGLKGRRFYFGNNLNETIRLRRTVRQFVVAASKSWSQLMEEYTS